MSGLSAVFVHHSVGRQLMAAAGVRDVLSRNGVALTDVDYNRIGATGPNGAKIHAPAVPNDNTDIAGYARLLSAAGSSEFVKWLAEFDLVVLKSCYPNSQVGSAAEADTQRTQLRAIINEAGKQFRRTLWLTPPPLAVMRTSAAAAVRASDLAAWTSSYSKPQNVTVFDLHAILAEAQGRRRGMLRSDFQRLIPFDSHPNTRGAEAAGLAVGSAILGALGDRHG